MIEQWRDATEWMFAQADNVSNFVIDNEGILVFEVVAAVAAFALWRAMHPKNKADDMKRRTQLESTYADKIQDFMLQMLVDGDITRAEYKRDCKRMGIGYRLFDLLRPVKGKIGMKHRVRHNCDVINHSTSSGKIPGPKPGESVTPPKSRKKFLVVVAKKSA